MQTCRRGRKGLCWCSPRHRSQLGSRLCRSNAQAGPKANGAAALRKGCRRPAEPCRFVSRRGVVRCLSCMRRKVPVQFLGEGVRVTSPPYPTREVHCAIITDGSVMDYGLLDLSPKTLWEAFAQFVGTKKAGDFEGAASFDNSANELGLGGDL